MKEYQYQQVRARIEALIEGETDAVTLMATVACELHLAFEAFHWTGFYRVVEPGLLKVGPYQGGHGCLAIPFGKGVCGTVAETGTLLRLDDVDSFPGHIACSSTTKSEIVLPVTDKAGALVAVLDIDSDLPAAFDTVDERELTAICRLVGDQMLG
jgi:GAF domain-containing protein